MHRNLLAAFVAFAAAFPASAGAAERRFTVTDFDRVQISGAYRVRLATGRAASAIASGPRDALDRVSIEVQGRTLRVRPNRSAWGGYPGEQNGPGAQNGPLTIVLTTQDLRAATVDGAGLLDVDSAKAMRLELIVAGSGQLNVARVQADTLLLTQMGAGTIRLGGNAKSLRAEIHGAGSVEAAGLTADDAQIAADTAGTVRLRVTRAAKITASGSGDVEILGTPACTVKAIGAGQVKCGR
jgi:hypothetical protein